MRLRSSVLLALLGCTSDGPAPKSVESIPDRPACSGCSVRFDHLVTLGGPDDPVSLDGESALEPCRIGRFSTGEFVTSAAVGGGELVVYDSTGRATRSIGRRGQGPGELLGNPLLTVAAGDTLHLADNVNGRLQVLTPAGGHARSFRLPARVPSLAVLSDGSYVLAPSWPEIREVGQPLFTRLAPDGTPERAIGAFDGIEVRWGQEWIISPAYPTGFWEGRGSRFRANRWSGDGELQRSIRRVAGWFPEDAELSGDFPASPPPAGTLYHIHEDREERLWLFVLKTEERWEPWPEADEGHSPSWVHERFRTRVDVVGLEQGTLIVSGESDLVLMPMCGSALVYSAVETPEGDIRAPVFELVLEGREP